MGMLLVMMEEEAKKKKVASVKADAPVEKKEKKPTKKK